MLHMKIRKAILTGGGHATRLHPITTTTNKHLLPLANKPMIFHAIEKAVGIGVKDIFINVNPGDTQLQKYIGDGGHWGIDITYFEQTGGPQGIAHVVNEAKHFIGDDPFLYYLSDNVLLGGLQELVDEFISGNHDAMMALAQVPDPERFGVPVFDSNGRLIDVLEKPVDPPNNFAATGIYLFGPKLFFKAFDNIEKSARGEYEIPSIYSYLLRNNHKVGYKEITGWWKDTGKPEDLLAANKLLLDQISEMPVSPGVSIDDSTDVSGVVHIGSGSAITAGVKICGPVIVAENCVLSDCTIGPNVTIGSGSEIKNATISDSIVLDNVSIDSDVEISNSIIGKSAKVLKKKAERKTQRMIIGDKTIIEL